MDCASITECAAPFWKELTISRKMLSIIVMMSTAKVKRSGAKSLSITKRMASCNNFDIYVCQLFTKPEVNTENDRHHFQGGNT